MQHLLRRYAGSMGLLVGLGAFALVGGCNALTGVGDLQVSGAGGSGQGGASNAGGTSPVGGGAAPGVGGSAQQGPAGPGVTNGTGTNASAGAGAGSSTSGPATTSTSAGPATTSTSVSTSASTGGGGGGVEQSCVDFINQLRATRSLPAYSRWTANESCVDGEATTDAAQMTPHYAFGHGMACGSNAQNECPNWPVDPSGSNGITACLQQMWNEKNQAGCAGCDTCDFPYTGAGCTNCEFNGATVCGHYLNMKSAIFTTVACGFSNNGWYAQDFKP